MAEPLAQRILLRKTDGLLLLEGLPDPEPVAGSIKLPASSLAWSEDGSMLVLVADGSVTVLDGQCQQQGHAQLSQMLQVQRFELPEVVAAAFSCSGRYLHTFQRPVKGDNANKNLKLFDMTSGELVLQLYQKSMSKEAWPVLQLSADEASVCHMVNNAVNIYSTADFAAGVKHKLHLKAVAGCALSSAAGSPKLAAYMPEAKGAPGFVGIWDVAALDSGAGNAPSPLARRTFFRATSVQLLWNSTGTAVLALTASEVDATNQSYYGEQKLHFLSADGANECLVPGLKEGPVHDVRWSPNGRFFVVVAGFMPAKTVLFDAKCKALYELGVGAHNMVRWNPHSRFFVLCGFGNLPGDMNFYDKKADGKCKSMGAARANNGVTCEWAPDGRHVMTATIAPRLRVDNGIQVFKYNGSLVHQACYPANEFLFEACWQPASAGSFPDRPQSPRADQVGAAGSSGAASPTPARPAGYVPPHQRGTGAAPPAPSFSLAYEPGGVGRLLAAARGPQLVPGQAPPGSKSASKNAKRNRSKQAKKGPGAAAEAESAASNGAGPSGGSAAAAEGPEANGAQAPPAEDHSAQAAEQIAAASLEGSEQPSGAADTPKKVKALHKKLRQIEELKAKLASAGSAAIQPEQQQKLATESAILAELRELGEQV